MEWGRYYVSLATNEHYYVNENTNGKALSPMTHHDFVFNYAFNPVPPWFNVNHNSASHEETIINNKVVNVCDRTNRGHTTNLALIELYSVLTRVSTYVCWGWDEGQSHYIHYNTDFPYMKKKKFNTQLKTQNNFPGLWAHLTCTRRGNSISFRMNVSIFIIFITQ